MLVPLKLMPNRFTIKDFLFLGIGLAVCLLLFLNMVKTNREAEALAGIEQAIKDQTAALQQLHDATTDGTNVLFRDTISEFLDQQWQTAPDAQLPADFSPGGTIIHIRNAEPATLTPFVARDSYANDIHADVFEKLCWRNLDPPFQYVPGLARSWTISDDGLQLVFHLFPNARFSDGRPVTADDVIFTLDLIFNEQIDAPGPRSLLADNVADYTALDSHTVRFRMRQPYFDALGICGNLVWILPRHIYGQFDASTYNDRIADLCVGSGPWVLDSWDRGRQLILKRNENYWGPKPALAQQTLRFINIFHLGTKAGLLPDADGIQDELGLHPSADARQGAHPRW